MVTDSGDLVVLAIQRKGEDVERRDRRCAAGDTLLLQGTWGALDEHLGRPGGAGRRRAARSCAGRRCRSGPGARRALAVLAAMVVLLATGAVPPAVAGLLAAGAIVVLAAC